MDRLAQQQDPTHCCCNLNTVCAVSMLFMLSRRELGNTLWPATFSTLMLLFLRRFSMSCRKMVLAPCQGAYPCNTHIFEPHSTESRKEKALWPSRRQYWYLWRNRVRMKTYLTLACSSKVTNRYVAISSCVRAVFPSLVCGACFPSPHRKQGALQKKAAWGFLLCAFWIYPSSCRHHAVMPLDNQTAEWL